MRSSLDWLFLLSEPESIERDTSDLDDSESDSWQITDGVTRSTETSNEHLVVFIDESHTTILRNESSDSLVVLLELNSDTLSDGGVGLLGFDSDLFDDDACGVGRTSEGLSPLGVRVRLVVVLIGPSIRNKVKTRKKRYLLTLL